MYLTIIAVLADFGKFYMLFLKNWGYIGEILCYNESNNILMEVKNGQFQAKEDF